MKRLLVSSVVLACAAFAAAGAARANESFLTGTTSTGAASSLTIGTVSPAYGMMTLPVAAADPVQAAAINGAALGQEFAARYSTSIYGGQLGVFARIADRPVFLSTDSSRAFNLGASVGYAGFYFQGAYTGLNDNGFVRTLQSWQSFQAGLGFGADAFDVRLTYAVGQSTPAFAGRTFDNSQWMLGGIYQIAPGIRFNADAFLGSRLISPGVASAAPGATAPQGTGARVGVQLRF
jgi:hypothetical protein